MKINPRKNTGKPKYPTIIATGIAALSLCGCHDKKQQIPGDVPRPLPPEETQPLGGVPIEPEVILPPKEEEPQPLGGVVPPRQPED